VEPKNGCLLNTPTKPRVQDTGFLVTLEETRCLYAFIVTPCATSQSCETLAASRGVN
jgi:hypothetical protein